MFICPVLVVVMALLRRDIINSRSSSWSRQLSDQLELASPTEFYDRVPVASRDACSRPSSHAFKTARLPLSGRCAPTPAGEDDRGPLRASCLRVTRWSLAPTFLKRERTKTMTEENIQSPGGLSLHIRSWRPAGAARGAVIIVPGFNSHSG